MTTASIFFLFTLLSSYHCSNYSYKFYPSYHFGPLISDQMKVGWMNDPNGFCLFNNEYHLFYQYNPNSSVTPGTVHWGHAKSRDLVNWEQLPAALYPDNSYDKNGVFSGSCLVENNVMYLYYTGNINLEGQTPDHEQQQILATSTDGKTFTKYEKNPVIVGADHQPNFRHPNVWKHHDTYYMVLGNSYNNDTLGQVLLYTSKDRINWNQVSVLDKSDGKLGYMWECPNLFQLGRHFVLMFSPQGVKPEGDKYNNLYSTGYIVGDFDYETNVFTPIHPYKELDHGHDVYATQTMVTREGERVLVAWMDMWDQNYPEGPDGFTGMLTIPRILKLTLDGHILQQPLKDINHAVGKRLHGGRTWAGQKVQLEQNAARVEVRASRRKDFTLVIESNSNDTLSLNYDYEGGLVTLNRGGRDGIRSTKYRPLLHLHMTVYIDHSSVEVFFGVGEVTMSSRFFPSGTVSVSIGDGEATDMTIHSMHRTIASPSTYV